MPDDLLIRNINRKRTTDNRYVIDSNAYWREELHARVENIPGITEKLREMIQQKITDNVWGFPVDEQSTPNTEKVLFGIVDDYFGFVAGRRVWVYTETAGYWTEEKIRDTIAYAFLMALWDLGNEILIDNYPLVADDLRLRYGKTHSNDERETKHDSNNLVNSADMRHTQQDNTRNKIVEVTDGVGSNTSDGRTTSNTTGIQDTFLSPQDQGVLPSKQSDSVMNRTHDFQDPTNMGVEEVVPNGDAKFTTATTNNFSGDTSTTKEGQTSTSRDLHNRADERDFVQGDATTESLKEAENNVGARARNDTGHERQETLDTSAVLQSFYNLSKDRLLMEIDNRMLPYYLNMKIARFTDHRIDRKEYV